MRGLRLAAALMLVGIAPAAARVPMPAFIDAETVESRTVLDGATVALADGRVLRLAGIEAPVPEPLALHAKQAVATLIQGKRLELRYAGARTDRAGRVVAELYAGGRWVERALVRRGLARVRGAADERLGLKALMATEDTARRARRGLWRERRYRVRDVADAARNAGTWQIVAGTVADVIPGSEGMWLVFGAD
ncbi:MAG: thermonuclease family protein, partial [Stellaceae bacterium]